MFLGLYGKVGYAVVHVEKPLWPVAISPFRGDKYGWGELHVV